LPIDAGAEADGIADRHVNHALQPAHVMAAVAALDVAFELVGRLLRYQQHRAARGVAAEQRALRAFQHLHVLQVEEVARPGSVARRRRSRPTRCDHVGEIDADRGAGAQFLKEAAD
jgi:hypothetical protein